MRGEQKLDKTLLGEAQMRRMIRRMAGEIVERNGGAGHLMLGPLSELVVGAAIPSRSCVFLCSLTRLKSPLCIS